MKKENNLNKKRIAKFIFEQKETSKQEIASELGISMPTVLQNVKELIQIGLIEERGKYESTGGRKAAVLSIAEGFKVAVGVDITEHHINYILMDLCGKIIIQKRISLSFADELRYYKKLVSTLNEFIAEIKQSPECILGVGFSLPGIIDKKNEELIRSHVLKQNHMNLKQLSQMIPYEAAYENDANSALTAEMHNIKEDTIYLSLSNSLGGSIYIDGKIYEGKNHRSAEFGHMILNPDGDVCYCGKKGCADACCSASVLLKYSDSAEEFFELLKSGDTTIKHAWDNYLDDLARLITNLRMTFDCNIMLGGYMGGYLRQYMPELSQATMKYNMFENDTVYLKNSTYAKNASAIGAAMYFLDKYFEEL